LTPEVELRRVVPVTFEMGRQESDAAATQEAGFTEAEEMLQL
jgi:hypothetical protein